MRDARRGGPEPTDPTTTDPTTTGPAITGPTTAGTTTADPTTADPTTAGPTTAVAARNGVGFVSQRATPVEQTGPGETVQVLVGHRGHEVGPTDVLTWVWFPERSLPAGRTEPEVADLDGFWAATAFALDVVFTDGTRLSSGDADARADGGDAATRLDGGAAAARDQYGDRVTPAAQDDARKQWVDQWNRRTVDLSAHAGRVVDRLEARLGRADRPGSDDGSAPAPDGPGGPVPVAGDGAPTTAARRAVRGWLDDVRIEPAGRATGRLSDGARPSTTSAPPAARTRPARSPAATTRPSSASRTAVSSACR